MWNAIVNMRKEFRPMLVLAVPVVLAEIGWITMGMVDTIMVGSLGPEAIGAVGLGHSLFITLAIFGIGILLGLDPLIAHAFGAGKIGECHAWLRDGVILCFLLAVPQMGVVWLLQGFLGGWGFHPDVLALVGPYFRIVSWSLVPLLLYATFRRYLQSMNIVIPIMFALISANGVNAGANWVLIYGNLGAPAMGTEGAAWATCLARSYMALVLLLTIVWHDRRRGGGLGTTPLVTSVSRFRRLIGLGLPAAVHLTLEIGVFAAVTMLVGRMNPSSLAAHQIALHLVSFTFMIPLGFSSAGAVRVGQAVGRRDPEGATHAGWMALLIGALFMSVAALAFVLIPLTFLGWFTSDPVVLATGVALLRVGALFQMFDGVQVVATGALRGLGDTRTAMITNLTGHWFLGLPLGYSLAFVWDWGVVGMWLGLSFGLILVALVLLSVWAGRARALRMGHDPALTLPL